MDKKNKEEKCKFDFNLSKRWISGIPYEVAFWRSYYRYKKSRSDLMRWSQYGKECELDNFDIASFFCGLNRDNPVIVDVGCALSYVFSNIIGGKEYNVTYLDPLAPYYNKILDDYSLPYPRITFGMGETLSLHFPADSVSMFHIRNALDHSVCPMSVIWQAIMCLHTGGVLYLNHKPNEAEHEAYVGFHQYNVDCNYGRLIIWNREERIDVGEELSEYADVKASVTDDGRIIGIITKKKELPRDHEEVKASGAYAAGMLETLLTHFHSLPNVVSYQSRRGAFSIAHGFMRILPIGLVKKIKALISGKKVTM
ncbi:MAG: hypothetical protein K2K45_05570 [Muribaculaceae bacterium]|nr:hypothetical protein [Muribaculaceae bacterium]